MTICASANQVLLQIHSTLPQFMTPAYVGLMVEIPGKPLEPDSLYDLLNPEPSESPHTSGNDEIAHLRGIVDSFAVQLRGIVDSFAAQLRQEQRDRMEGALAHTNRPGYGYSYGDGVQHEDRDEVPPGLAELGSSSFAIDPQGEEKVHYGRGTTWTFSPPFFLLWRINERCSIAGHRKSASAVSP